MRRLCLILTVAALGAACGCRAEGPYTVHASIEMPGETPRQIDEVIAQPVARRLFRANGGVLEVVSISAAGKVDLFATSDGVTKQSDFVGAMSGSIADSAGTLPRNAVVKPIELLPKGQPIPNPPVYQVENVRIDIDRVKLIDSGLSEQDVAVGVAREREQEAASPAESATEPTVSHKIDLLNATTLPSRGQADHFEGRRSGPCGVRAGLHRAARAMKGKVGVWIGN